jgi:SlyX protein
MSETGTNARIEALEMRIAHQDVIIEDLNTSVTAQWKQIETLTKQVDRFVDRLKSIEDNASSSGEVEPPPPHY